MMQFAVTDVFFDRPAVQRMMDKRSHAALGRFGSYCRSIARNSIKHSTDQTKHTFTNPVSGETFERTVWSKVSKPGQPPISHSRLLKDFIFFSYDPNSESVVVGPELKTTHGEIILQALEYGGETFNRFHRRAVFMKARPFMGPAFEKAQEKLPEFWAQAR